MALTDKLRAAVFARDKGICAFSGRSVWILDDVTPFWQQDWPDHIKPISSGGEDTPENLVCASYFYNRKKLNNGSDNAYLFQNGAPSYEFFRVHGEVTEELSSRLARHSVIEESDWYFNRALSHVLEALDVSGKGYVRDPKYWRRAAAKKLHQWRRQVGVGATGTFVERGLVRFPDAPDVQLMLSLARAGTDELRAVEGVHRRLAPYHRANTLGLNEFALASSAAERRTALARAERRRGSTAPMLAYLRRSAARLEAL